jgi:hypothetical protein
MVIIFADFISNCLEVFVNYRRKIFKKLSQIVTWHYPREVTFDYETAFSTKYRLNEITEPLLSLNEQSGRISCSSNYELCACHYCV